LELQPTIKTERLILRPLNLSDAKKVQILAGNKLIAATTMNVPHPYPNGAAEEWINSNESAYDERKRVVFAVTLKNSNDLIGVISLTNIIENHQAELGYWIGVPYWNKGYCTEAGEAVLRYGFKDMGLNRIHACYLSSNPASGRVLEKLGMNHEGKRRQHILKWGIYQDLELMGILRTDWEKPSYTHIILDY
jgi:RimJ/RimL family protein N-acetyltransferase